MISTLIPRVQDPAIGEPVQLPQRVGHRQQRQLFPQQQTPNSQGYRAILPGAVQYLGNQTGLADAGVTGDEHQTRPRSGFSQISSSTRRPTNPAAPLMHPTSPLAHL